MKSFIPWVGGKSLLAKKIVSLFPDDIDRYIEVFGCGRRNLSPDYLEQIEKRLEKVVIENKDFDDLIRVYDRPKALFYCDPPYRKTENYYCNATFSKVDHERLKAVLSDIKGRFVLSYNDDEYIRELYRDFEIIPVERQNNLSQGTYKELIIRNF